MADLTAAACSGTVAYVAACFLEQRGLPGFTLFCGFVGAGYGVVTSEQMPKTRMVWSFGFSMLGGCILGAIVARRWAPPDQLEMYRNWGAIAFSALMLKLHSAAVEHLGPLLKLWANKLGPKA